MVTNGSVAASCGYVVTEIGRAASSDPVHCRCQLQVRAGFLGCWTCGTIYGIVAPNTRTPWVRTQKRD